MNSFSHYSFGAVSGWMFQNLVGIDLLEPGWTSFRISPRPLEGLDWIEASYDCPTGLIEVSWKRSDDGTLALNLTVPPNTTAELDLPVEQSGLMTTDGKPAEDLATVSWKASGANASTWTVGSGRYSFTYPRKVY